MILGNKREHLIGALFSIYGYLRMKNQKFQHVKFYGGLVLAIICFTSCSETDSKKESPQGPLFKLIDAQTTGIHFNNRIKESGLYNHIAWENVYHGAGVAIGDINNDDLPDIYFTGNQVQDRLYLNKGNLQFEDITKNIDQPQSHYWSSGVTMVDINGDGFLDIYVNKSGPSLSTSERKNLLLINQGDLTFKEEGEKYGLAETGYSIQTAFFDYDGDGDLDAYVMNQPPSTQKEKMLDRIKQQSCVNFTDRLLRNELKTTGSFVDVTDQAGVRNCAYGLGLSIVDVNQDGWDDIYVSNDYFASDHLYVNQGNGTFSDEAKKFFNHQSLYAMGCDAGDFNNDGLIDFITADMSAITHYRNKANMPSMNTERFDDIIEAGYAHQYMFNTLQLNQGNGHFSDIAQLAGIANTDWTWGILWMDADNDSDLDIVATNGIKKEVRNVDALNMLRQQLADGVIKLSEILSITPSERLPNFAYRNNGNLSFERASDWGIEKESFSNGVSYGDLDNDGDLDLVINNVDQKAFVYENQSVQNFLKVKLEGDDSNSYGEGAKLKLRCDSQTLYRELRLVRGYQSSVDAVVHFGLGEISKIDWLEITWPDGSIQQLEDLGVNQLLKVKKPSTQSQKKFEAPKFESVEEDIKFVHKERPYDDFKNEVLLPYKLSELGPALAKGDVNNDGLEDFYVGGAAGQPGKLFIQDKGGFIERNEPWASAAKYEEIGAMFLDINGDGNLDLYIASGSNEFEKDSRWLADRIYLGKGNGEFSLGQVLDFVNTSTKAIAPFDIDSDGDLDLFVGSRLKQQSYPLSAKSYLLINEDGQLKNHSEQLPNNGEIGMVTDAIWLSNKKGSSDLWVVGEWMEIKTMRWRAGNLEQVENGLQETVGLWQSIAHFDIDHDGDEDLIVGNFGLNSKFKANDEKSLHLFANDFDSNGSLDIVLSNEQRDQFYPVRGRECSSQQMPSIKEKFKTYNEFASATLQDIYSVEKLDSAFHSELNELRSICLINEEGTFRMVPLPQLTQISPIYSGFPIDIDGDSKMEYLVYGNLYETEIETTRLDGSYGALLSWEDNEIKASSATSRGLGIRGNSKSAIFLEGEVQKIVIGINNRSVKLLEIK